MLKFPVDAPKRKVIKALANLGFILVREKEHISMIRINSDRTKTPLTMPNHSHIKSSTFRTICTQAGISREDFIYNVAEYRTALRCGSSFWKIIFYRKNIKQTNLLCMKLGQVLKNN